MTGWRPALRITRRNLWNYKLRSLLVLTLVAIPAFAGTLIAVTYQSGHVTSEQRWASQFGSADLSVSTPVDSESSSIPYDPKRAQRDLDAVRNLLPSGSIMIADEDVPTLTVSHGERGVDDLSIHAVNMSDPVNAGLLSLVSGRWPTGPAEVALSRADLEQLNVRLGQTVDVSTQWLDIEGKPAEPLVSPATVVAEVDAPFTFQPSAIYLQAPHGPIAARTSTSAYWGAQARIVLPPGASRDDVAQYLTDAGFATQTPESWGLYAADGSPTIARLTSTGVAIGALTSAAIFIGFVVVVLLVTVAHAVGARRAQRDLELVAVTGGSPRQLKMMALGEGLIIGICSGLVGFIAALVTFVAARDSLAELIQVRLDRPLVVGWFALGACVTSVAVSVCGAWLSAQRVTSVTPTLGGNYRHSVGANRGYVPRIAGAAVIIGVLGTAMTLIGIERLKSLADVDFSGAWFRGINSADQFQFAAFFLLLLLGLVALIPQLLGLIGRHCRSLPLVPRLAIRDAARSGHRTAPVVAAVLAVTTLGVGALIVAAGIDTQRQDEFLAATPNGVVSASLYDYATDEDQSSVPTALAHLRQAVSPTAEYLVRGTGVEIINSCDPDGGQCSTSPVSIADPALIMRLAAVGTDEVAVRQKLATGGIVAFDTSQSAATDRTFDGIGAFPRRMTNGKVVAFENDLDPRTAPTAELSALMLQPREDSQLNAIVFGSTESVSAVPMPSPERPWSASNLTAIYTIGYPMTNEQIDGMNSALSPYQLSVDAHRTFAPKAYGIAVAIAALTGAIAILATSIVAALGIVEQRADMATLTAIGATPRRQRQLACTQSALLAGIGVFFGIILGVYLGTSATDGTWFQRIVPWDQVAAVAFGVPLLAAATTWLFASTSPSRPEYLGSLRGA